MVNVLQIWNDSMKNSNRLQQWVDKNPDRFSFFIVSIFALAFIAILICLLIGELYLLFFLVGVGGGSFGYFVFNNVKHSDGNEAQAWTSSDSFGSSLLPPDDSSKMYDPAYSYIPGNIHHHDHFYNDSSRHSWRDDYDRYYY